MRVILIFLLTVSLIVATIAGWLFIVSKPRVVINAPTRSFRVNKGETLRSIADRLEKEQYIRSAIFFRFMYENLADSKAIQAGSYDLSSSMSPQAIVKKMSEGASDNWVTLLEGWRSEEIADELGKKLDPKTFSKEEFLSLAKGAEGRLFPDTYLIPKQANAQYVFSLLTSTFAKKIKDAKEAAKSTQTLSDDDIVILASLIEREAREPSDMNIVAGILTKRIAMGMPLQVDATLQYARGFSQSEKTWWPVPKASDKDIESLFNTYAHKGLPPSPICNPSLNALKAAAHPDTVEYLYYLTDTKGVMHYANDYKTHQKNIETYLK